MKIMQLMSARYFVGEAGRVLDLVGAQRAAGHEVSLVLRKGYEVEAQARQRELEHECLTFGSRFRPLLDVRDIMSLRRMIRARGVEVVHAHRGKDHWLAAVALAGMRGEVKLVRTRHVVMPIRNHLANRWLYHRVTNGLIVVSRAVGEVVERDLENFGGTLRVIQGGVNPLRARGEVRGATRAAAAKLRERLRIPEHNRVITLLGRVAWVKGHEHVLRAFSQLLALHPNSILVLAYSRANDEYRLGLERMIKDLGIKHNLRWLGMQQDIAPLLATTDLGLVASVGSEGWSRVAIEFMHAGTPLVATSVGSLPEIVRHEKTGLLIPPADAQAMSAALAQLLDDEDLRARMSEQAQVVAGHFTRERMTREVEDFYRQVR